MEGNRPSPLVPAAMATLTLVLCAWAFVWMSGWFDEQRLPTDASAAVAEMSDVGTVVDPIESPQDPSPHHLAVKWDDGVKLRYEHAPDDGRAAGSLEVDVGDVLNAIRVLWPD